jgi:predicted acyl esterase
MAEHELNKVKVEHNVLIPLSDGCTLAADLYRPTDDGAFPTLISYYPYHKDDFMGAFLGPAMTYFAARGYAHLLVDFRGVGGSSGIAWEMMEGGKGAMVQRRSNGPRVRAGQTATSGCGDFPTTVTRR